MTTDLLKAVVAYTVPYYLMEKQEWLDIYKCWTCLSSTEKLERDGSMKDPAAVQDKTIKEVVYE